MKKLLFYASAVAVLFSSCSKDVTEDVVINKAGNEVFSATILSEDENSTRVTLNGSTYVWDVNDAIGVASEQAPDANIQVSTNVGGVNPKFSVSSEDYGRWLEQFVDKDNAMFAYFPYKAGTTFTPEGVVTINIPAEQRFAPKSFFKNSIFAVGFAPAYNGAEQELELTVPHSLIRVNVIGWGDLEEISLEIADKNGNDIILNGEYIVDVMPKYTTNQDGERDYEAYGKDELITIPTHNATGTKTTVDLGFKPEGLDYSDALPVHFVVPAGINLSQAILIFQNGQGDTFSVTMPKEASEGKMTLRPNLRVTVGTNVQFGLDDKFLILDDDQYTAEEKFLAYAYANSGDATIAEAGAFDFIKKFVPEGIAEDAEALIIDTELDFASYTKAWAEAAKKEIDAILVFDEVNHFWSELYAWYIKNDGAISSIVNNAVIGAKHGDNGNTVIKNLNVKGNGFIASVATSHVVDLQNITFQNVTVDAYNYPTAGLIAGNSYYANVKDVVISTGNKVIADGVVNVGGVYGTLNESDKAFAAAEAIAIEAKDCQFVGRLYGKVLETVELTLADKFAWDASVADYPVIANLKEGAHVIADVAVDASMKNAGVVGKVDVTYQTNGQPGFDPDTLSGMSASSVIVAGVSYWNGDYSMYVDGFESAPAEKDPSTLKWNQLYTAEMLATTLQGASQSSITLNTNIDMQGDHMAFFEDDVDGMLLKPEFTLTIATQDTDRSFNVNGRNFTIANINVVAKADHYNDGRYDYIALFGQNPTIKNIKISGYTLSTEFDKEFAISGLGYSGEAENVTVEDVHIQTKYAPSFKGAGIGAIFAVVDAKNIKNVSVKNCVISAPEQNVTVGYVAGVLTLSEKLVTVSGINVSGDNYIQTAAKGMSAKAGRVNTSYAANLQYAYAGVPFGVVDVTCADFSTAGTIQNKLTVTNSSYGDTFAAGYWFKHYADAKKDVVLSKTAFADINVYDYVFTSNANVNNYFNNIAFDKK